MSRAVLTACLPWLGLTVALFALLVLLVRLAGARLEWRRLRRIHGDEAGSVQTLSFVLTLPVFIMVVLLIVQVSQLMIGKIVVEYAAFAAARSAIVWIPARVGSGPEWENCIGWYYMDPDVAGQVVPILDPSDPDYGPGVGGVTFVIERGSAKYRKIESAAVLACMPIAPSRDLGQGLSGDALSVAEVVKAAYRSMVPGYDANPRIARRLENKLAYALNATRVELRFYHSNRYPEPPLMSYPLLDDVPDDLTVEYMPNEIGWQDTVTATVRHDLALLPGPGRLLARRVRHPDGSTDRVADAIVRQGSVYVYPLEATATLGNEGQKSVIPYVHYLY
jgi:hypothetical protein